MVLWKGEKINKNEERFIMVNYFSSSYKKEINLLSSFILLLFIFMMKLLADIVMYIERPGIL